MDRFVDGLMAVMHFVLSAKGYLIIYGGLALLHILLQYTFALLHGVRLRQIADERSKHRREFSGPVPDSLAVWVPVYQEKLTWLLFCLDRLQKFKFAGRVKVVVVDDGSYLKQIAKYSHELTTATGWLPAALTLQDCRRFLAGLSEYEGAGLGLKDSQRLEFYLRKRLELLDVFEKYRNKARFEFVLLAKNVGKRQAQLEAWRKSQGYKLYGTVDSDTGVNENAFALLAENFRNPDVAAATGYVDVGNWNHSWLTRLIDMRYWSAFHVERAAQSYWNCVMCCSGPLAVYRADVVDRVMGQYVTQTFRNEECTFGDDRHFTNLILALGLLVLFDPRATCQTEVPTTIRQYIPQQKRWQMSYYREMLWSLQGLRTHSWYMTYDLTMQFVLPFMLLGGVGVTVHLAINGNAWLTVGYYVATILAVGFIRSLYPFFARKDLGWGTRRWSQLMFMGYGVVHITILTPLRFVALFTLIQGGSGWGTRIA
ncbi:MAG TPA: glycosyltransferase [Magnetospirillaceae bacterium]|nr:glycosyltransferase [Magnetospirillaceae bacterium]